MSKKITPCTDLQVVESPWMTAREAAEYLKLKPRTLQNYVSRGLVPVSISVTNTKRFHKNDLDNWLSNGKQNFLESPS